MTNTLLATADNCADDDIKYTMSGSDVTVSSGFELWIEGGKTYTPGAMSVQLSGGSFDRYLSPEANTVTISGVGTPLLIRERLMLLRPLNIPVVAWRIRRQQLTII